MYYTPAHLKDMNRHVIYQILSDGIVTSRAELSRRSGISLPTVNKVIKHFTELQIVVEIGDDPTQENHMGRPPQRIRFNAGAFLAFGIEYEGGAIKAGLVDLSGEVKALRVEAAPDGIGAGTANLIADLMEELIATENVDRSSLLGVGIGLPGVVDVENRTLTAGPLVGVSGSTSLEPMGRIIEERLGLAVAFDNDVNAAAIGEYTARGAGDNADLVFVSLGTGLGGGIILDGKLRRGRHNFAGELGYMIFDEDSDSQTSKVGWLEARIGLNSGKPVEPDTVATLLALSIVNCALTVGVEAFVIGGTALTGYGEDFLSVVAAKVAGYSDLPLSVEPSVCAEAGVVGAASLVMAEELNERWRD